MHKGVNIAGPLHAARENVGETWPLNLNLEIVSITKQAQPERWQSCRDN